MKYREEDILRILGERVKERGRLPTKKEITEDKCLPSYETMRKYFGDLRNMSRTLGFKLVRRRFDEEEIFTRIKKWSQELGRMPTAEEIKKDTSLPSPTTLAKYFGSWKGLREQLGFQPVRRIIYTDERLLSLLKAKTEQLGRAITIKELIEDRSLPAIGTYITRFGSVGRALKAIGYETRKGRKAQKSRN
ncbi:MAG: hypothetical protein HY769_10310 [Candidatus Stahlbacteria bacterium]|nr:hypothetical protein [Candidatus Stahlbacteria bacterium]